MEERMYVSGSTLQNRKGFTLIELLAVIVILAIIALIATPIVLNIINDSRESSAKISAENYVKALENSIAQAPLQNKKLEDGFYRIMEDGNICSGTIEQKECNGTILKVDISGDIPKKGNLTLDKGQVVRSSLIYNTSTIEIDFDGNVEYLPFAKEYEIGEKVSLELTGIGNVDFYVINEDSNSVDILPALTPEEMGKDNLDWVSSSDCSKLSNNTYTDTKCVAVGPYTMLKASYSFGLPTDKFLPIKNYVYENNKIINDKFSYKKYEIDNDVVKITTSDGTVLSETVGDTYLRFLSAEEILEIASMYNVNLRYDNIKKILNKNLDKLNDLFIISNLIDTRAKDISELFNILKIDDNWKTTTVFATYIFSISGLQDDLSTLALPTFFGKDGEIWWTLSSAKVWNDANVIIQIKVDENNKPYLTLRDRITAYSSDGYKTVARVSKETLRKTLN